jgi:hypothetical protein
VLHEHNGITKSTSGISEIVKLSVCSLQTENAAAVLFFLYSLHFRFVYDAFFCVAPFLNDLTPSFQPVLKLIIKNTVLLSENHVFPKNRVEELRT